MNTQCSIVGCPNMSIEGYRFCYSCNLKLMKIGSHVAHERNDTKINGKDEVGKLLILECMHDGFGKAIRIVIRSGYINNGADHIVCILDSMINVNDEYDAIMMAGACMSLVQKDSKDNTSDQEHQYSHTVAIQEIAKVWQFGLRDHVQGSWKNLTKDQLKGALYRHFLKRASCLYDKDSVLLHSAHMAWNALAIVWLESQEKDG